MAVEGVEEAVAGAREHVDDQAGREVEEEERARVGACTPRVAVTARERCAVAGSREELARAAGGGELEEARGAAAEQHARCAGDFGERGERGRGEVEREVLGARGRPREVADEHCAAAVVEVEQRAAGVDGGGGNECVARAVEHVDGGAGAASVTFSAVLQSEAWQ